MRVFLAAILAASLLGACVGDGPATKEDEAEIVRRKLVVLEKRIKALEMKAGIAGDRRGPQKPAAKGAKAGAAKPGAKPGVKPGAGQGAKAPGAKSGKSKLAASNKSLPEVVKGEVVVEGEATKVVLMKQRRKYAVPGPVPVGQYSVLASWGEETPAAAGSVEVKAEASVTITCDAADKRCLAE